MVRAQMLDFDLEAAPLEGFLDNDEQLVELKRLRDIVLGTQLHGFDGRRNRPKGRHNDYGKVGPVCA